jgi:hemolysin activation/secretion protein
MASGPASSEQANLQPPAQEQQEQQEAQAEVEQEMEVEPDTEAAPEPESSSPSEETQPDPESEAEPDAPKVLVKKAVKEKIAKRIMKRMGDKGRYDASNQLKTLVVMQILGNSKSFFDATTKLKDTPGFFSTATIPDATIDGNNFAQYILFGGSSAKHDAMVNSQYR